MKIFVILNVGLLIGLVIFAIGFPYWTAENVTIMVSGKERIAEEGGGKYLVFTEGEVFQNTDCLFRGKFNSSDVYGQLEPGKSYRALVYGWRIPFFSMYRNIVRISEEY